MYFDDVKIPAPESNLSSFTRENPSRENPSKEISTRDISTRETSSGEFSGRETSTRDFSTGETFSGEFSGREISSREISCQTNTEDFFLQAASLVNPSIWKEDGYILNVLNKGVRPNIITSGDFGRLRHTVDKRNMECFVEYGKQTFVHQYRWHDQYLHLYKNVFTRFTCVVPKRIFGRYNDVINELVEDGQSVLSLARELAYGSQKYIRLWYSFPTNYWFDNCNFNKYDDHNFYLFSDGHVYDPDALSTRSDFKLALSDNLDRTKLFIVKQIMVLNEQGKWNIKDVPHFDFRFY